MKKITIEFVIDSEEHESLKMRDESLVEYYQWVMTNPEAKLFAQYDPTVKVEEYEVAAHPEVGRL